MEGGTDYVCDIVSSTKVKKLVSSLDVSCW